MRIHKITNVRVSCKLESQRPSVVFFTHTTNQGVINSPGSCKEISNFLFWLLTLTSTVRNSTNWVSQPHANTNTVTDVTMI